MTAAKSKTAAPTGVAKKKTPEELRAEAAALEAAEAKRKKDAEAKAAKRREDDRKTLVEAVESARKSLAEAEAKLKEFDAPVAGTAGNHQERPAENAQVAEPAQPKRSSWREFLPWS